MGVYDELDRMTNEELQDHYETKKGRKVTVNVFSIEELEDKVREKLYDKWLGESYYFWENESMESIKEFCKFFNCELREYWVDWNGYDFDVFCAVDEESDVREIVESNYAYMKKYAQYGSSESCELTGYCLDDDLLEPIRKYLEGKSTYATYYYLMQDCLGKAFYSMQKDIEYSQSMECFMEECEGNGYLFTEKGIRIDIEE